MKRILAGILLLVPAIGLAESVAVIVTGPSQTVTVQTQSTTITPEIVTVTAEINVTGTQTVEVAVPGPQGPSGSGPTGGGSWGSITGTLSDQTDLQGILDNKADISALFSGSYNDLTDKPNLFSGAYADLSGLPQLFSGSYADLSGIPLVFAPDAHTQGMGTITGLDVRFNNQSTAIHNHRLETMQAHGGIGQMLASHEQLTGSAHGGLTPYGSFSSHTANTNNPHATTYSQLPDKPAIPPAQVNSDWNASGTIAEILNKPAIPIACVNVFDGKNATFRCSTTTTLPPGSPATVRNDGTSGDGVLKFGIPAGATGAAGLTGRPALFCNISTMVRSFSYDSSGLNPAPSLGSFAVQLWNGAVRIIAESYVWWTGGPSQRVYGSSSASTFTPSVKPVYSGYSSNNYVAVQVRYSSLATGRQYCTTGIPIAATRAGIKGDKGDPGSNATVDETSVIDALDNKTNSAVVLYESTANTFKIKFKDSNNYERFGITGSGKLVHTDPNGIIRFVYDPASYSLELKSGGNKTVFKIHSGHRTEILRRNGKGILKTYSGGQVVIGG